jgi:hypothetical protein
MIPPGVFDRAKLSAIALWLIGFHALPLLMGESGIAESASLDVRNSFIGRAATINGS